MSTATAAVSWSGGKDCCLALHRARASGIAVRFLLAMCDETGERTRSHAVPRAVMQAQADSLGLELVVAGASWDTYEPVFVAALGGLKERGVGTIVFGDIDLLPHREWEERVCAKAGLTACLPLWQEPRERLAREVLDLGYRPLVVCADDRWLDRSFAGRAFDEAFLADLPEGVDPCGENGEFHTFVVDGPAFRAPVPVVVAETETRDVPFGGRSYIYHYARLALGGNLTLDAAS